MARPTGPKLLAVILFLLCHSVILAHEVISTPLRFLAYGQVNDAVYSPDGKYIATVGNAGAFLWDLETSQMVRCFVGHRSWLTSVAFSHDGTRLLTGGYDGAMVWDTASGDLIRSFAASLSAVYRVDFAPDDTRIATAHGIRTTVWNAADATVLLTISASSGFAEFSPDGSMLLTAGWGAALWNSWTGIGIRQFDGHQAYISSAALSPDGTKLLTGSEDTTAKVWDVANGSEIYTLRGNSGPVEDVSYAPDGSMISTASGYPDGSVRIWDPDTGNLIHSFSGNTSGSHVAGFSPDSRSVLGVGLDSTVRIWDVSDGRSLGRLPHLGYCCNDVAFSPDGKAVATGDSHTLWIWDPSSGALLREIWTTGAVTSLAYSPNGSMILAGIGWPQPGAKIWNPETGEEILSLTWESHIDCVAFSPDGTKAMTAAGRDAKLWEIPSGRELLSVEHGSDISSIAFSPDGTEFLMAGHIATLREIPSGHVVFSVEHDAWITCVAFSPDGETFVTGGRDRNAKLWSMTDGSEIRTLGCGMYRICSVAFSPDGAWILVGGGVEDLTYQQTIHSGRALLWSRSTGLLVRTYAGHQADVTSAAFSPNGEMFVTGSGDGSARLWPMPPAAARRGWQQYE